MKTLSPNTNHFGLTTMTCVVIAGMIGSGIFTTSGFALADLQSPGRVLLAWLVGGLIALSGAVAYGELARRLPQSGGEYLYLSKLLHPFAGFQAGWISLTVGFSGSIALVALTFEEYVVPAEMRASWLPAGSCGDCRHRGFRFRTRVSGESVCSSAKCDRGNQTVCPH